LASANFNKRWGIAWWRRGSWHRHGRQRAIDV
jgi:hypothetical protein